MNITNLKKVAICIPVWGDAFWQRFKEVLLNDLLEEGNIPWLLGCGYEVSVYLYTDTSGMKNAANMPNEHEINYEFFDISTMSDEQLKYSVMDSSYQHAMDELLREGGGALMCLCADTIATKGLIKNALEYWHGKDKTVFLMPGVALAERKFSIDKWRQGTQTEQVNMVVNCVDERMNARNIHSSKFFNQSPSLLISGTTDEGFLFSGCHWHPVFVDVSLESIEYLKSYYDQIDSLQFKTNGVTDEKFLFCPGSDIGAVASISDDDLRTKMNSGNFDPFKVASWVVRGHKVDVDIKSRLSNRYQLKKDGRVIPEFHRDNLDIAFNLIVKAYELLKPEPELQVFYHYQGLNERFSPRQFEDKADLRWNEYMQLTLCARLKELNKPLFLFGGGNHTDLLFHFTDINSQLAGIIVPKIDASLIQYGLPLYEESAIANLQAEQPIAILISSISFQEVIKQRLATISGVQLITLY